jgi:hypothetical protein
MSFKEVELMMILMLDEAVLYSPRPFEKEELSWV